MGTALDCRPHLIYRLLAPAKSALVLGLRGDGFILGTLSGQREKVLDLYRWFHPLLRLDTLPNFVQLVKLVQAEVGVGSTRVRAPRLELVGKELEEVRRVIQEALRTRPLAIASLAMTVMK